MAYRGSFYLAVMLILIVTGLTLPPSHIGDDGSGQTETAMAADPAEVTQPADPATGSSHDAPQDEALAAPDTEAAEPPETAGSPSATGPPALTGPPHSPSTGTRSGNATPEPTDERSLEYLIITPQMWKKTLNKLAKWKTQKGVVARVDTVEQCQAAYPYEEDLAASIQAYLRQAKADNENLTWVLLAGDSEYIPERFLYTKWSDKPAYFDLDNYAAGDIYYAGLDHDWDLDNDTIYGERGEEDYEADVYVGRLPVGDPEQVRRAVDKILMYEQEPPEGDWYDSALLAGALMDVPNRVSNDTHFYYDWYKDNAYETITEVVPHLPDTMEANLLYDYDQVYGLNYSVANDTLYHESFTTSFDQGHSMVNIVSHGLDNGDEMRHYESTTGLGFTFYSYFDYQDAEAVQNGDCLPLVYMSSCDTANFTERDDTGMERIITAKNGGAIALIGGSATTYRGEFRQNDSSFGNWWMNERFFEAMYEEERTRPGQNLYELKKEYQARIAEDSNPNVNWSFQQIYRINTVAYNLLGDPEVDVYTSTPAPLNVTFTKTPHIDGTRLNLLVLDNETGEAVPDARVTLRYEGTPFGTRSALDGVFHATGYTDAQGRLDRDVSFREEGTYTLTVTAHDHIPNVSDVPITVRADLSFPEAPAPDGGGGAGTNGTGGAGTGGNATAGANGTSAASGPAGIEVIPAPGTSWGGGYLAGSNITVNVTVLNSGDVDHAAVELGLWLMPGRFDIQQLLDGMDDDQVPADIVGGDWVPVPGTPVNLTDVDAGSTATLETGFAFTNGTWTLVALVDPYGRIRETDPTNNGASTVFLENKPPELTAVPDLVMKEDSPGATLDLTRYAYDDLDPDGLTYDIGRIGEPGMLPFGGPEILVDILPEATVRAVPRADWFGLYTMEVIVGDGLSNASAMFRIIVEPVNDGPVLEDPGNHDAVEGEPFVLQLNASDVDPEDTNLTWSVNSTAVTLDQDGRLEFLPDDGHGPRIYLNISVSDGEATDWAVILIRIENRNDLPVLSTVSGEAAPGANLVVSVGGTLTFGFTASDPDLNDALKFTLTMVGEEDLYRQTNRDGAFTYAPTVGHVGTHTFLINVTDNFGSVDSYTFTVVVEKEEDPSEPTEDEGGLGQYLVLAAVAVAFVMVLLGSMMNMRKIRSIEEEGGEEMDPSRGPESDNKAPAEGKMEKSDMEDDSEGEGDGAEEKEDKEDEEMEKEDKEEEGKSDNGSEEEEKPDNEGEEEKHGEKD